MKTQEPKQRIAELERSLANYRLGAQLIFLAFPALLGLGGLLAFTSQEAALDPDIVPVVRVVDGDTIKVIYDAPPREYGVRLLGIDTPERDEEGYAEAKTALATMLGDHVRLEFEPNGKVFDNYGRILAWLKDEKGNLIQEAMIRQGHTKFADQWGKPMPYWEALQDLSEQD